MDGRGEASNAPRAQGGYVRFEPLTVGKLIEKLAEYPADMTVAVNESVVFRLEQHESAYSRKPYLNIERGD